MKLYNGDCEKVIDKLIEDGVKFEAIITSPPYNIGKMHSNKTQHGTYAGNNMKESEARWIVNYFTDESTPKPEALFKATTRYVYDANNDVYVITSRAGRDIELDGSDIRDIRRKYSNWMGDYETVKEIAFDYAHISLRDMICNCTV